MSSFSAKMDATENDIPPSAPFRVSGFPTIKFKPAGTREFIDYEGDRSLESLVEFVHAQAKNSLKPATSSAAEATTAAASTPVETAAATPGGEDEAQRHIEL